MTISLFLLSVAAKAQVSVPNVSTSGKDPFSVREAEVGTTVNFISSEVPFCQYQDEQGKLQNLGRGFLFKVKNLKDSDSSPYFCLKTEDNGTPRLFTFMGTSDASENKWPKDRIYMEIEEDLHLAEKRADPNGAAIVLKIDPCHSQGIRSETKSFDSIQNFNSWWGPFVKLSGCFLIISEGGDGFSISESSLEVKEWGSSQKVTPTKDQIKVGE